MQNKKVRDPLNESFNKLFKNILNESSIRDDIDANADDKKEYAKKVFMKKKDNADSDKDYKLKKSGLKEQGQLKEAATDILTTDEFLQWHDHEANPKENWVTLERIYDLFKTRGFDENDDVDVCYEQMPDADKVQITEWIKSTRFEESMGKKASKNLKETVKKDDYVEIYFDDLNEKAQEEILTYFGVSSPEDMNWDVEPLTIIAIGNSEELTESKKAPKNLKETAKKADRGDHEVTAGKFEKLKK